MRIIFGLLVFGFFYLWMIPVIGNYLTYGLGGNVMFATFGSWLMEFLGIIFNLAMIIAAMVIASLIVRRIMMRRESSIPVISAPTPKETNGNSDKGIIQKISSVFVGNKEVPKPAVRFSDVAGIDEVREELMEIVEFLKTPLKFTRLGGKIPKGVLLVGPPGVGKTLLGRAVAGEAERPFYFYAGSGFVEMYVGVGASRARTLFDTARKNSPCIVFIDEMDAIGKRTDGGGGGGDREYTQTINQFLAEIDGFEDNTGIILIGATNNIEGVDSAFLRPGRFDKIIQVHRPDIKGREEILGVHSKPPVIMSPTVDIKKIARMTAGFSGADLANLINVAAIDAAKDEKKDAIFSEDLERAKEKIGMGYENRSLSSVLSEEEKMVTAYHEAGHALIAVSLPGNDPLYKVSIIPRGNALGITSQLPEKDRYNYDEDFLKEMISILMGGRVAEDKKFKKITTGAENDIERATQIATAMVTKYGMSKLGMISFKISQEMWSAGRMLSEKTKRDIDDAIKEIIDAAYARTKEIIERDWAKLEKIAQALIEKETLDREQVEQIVNG